VDKQQIEAICAERLERWRERLVQEHATPFLLLGLGHDQKSGQVVVVTTEGMTDEQTVMFVAGTLKLLREGPQPWGRVFKELD